jgi:hypothetical protein
MTTDKPNPKFTYQGAQLTFASGDLSVGPFTFQSHARRSFGHAVDSCVFEGVPQTVLRPQATVLPADPCTTQFTMGYEQNDLEWLMVFRLTSDPAGGLKGGSFALDTDSNYPQTPMSIEKIEINQPSFGVLVYQPLPRDYRAQMTVRFWQRDRTEPPVDAWMMLEIGYVPDAPGRTAVKFPKGKPIPMVPLGQVLLYPAHKDSTAVPIGNNYPRQIAAARARATR